MTAATATISEVAGGVWAIPLTVPSPGLREVFVYAVECDGGVVLVDAGWPTAEALLELEVGLGAVGAGLADVRGILVTHVHADHYGLAADVQAASGAWIGMHPAEAGSLDLRYRRHDDLHERFATWLRATGLEEDRVDAVAASSLAPVGSVVAVVPDVLLVDGDDAPVGGDRLRCWHTPGHTPGHLVFELEGRALFTGDHLLPRSTPNVSYGPLSDPDPLGDYQGSLRRMVDLASDAPGLPAHQHVFAGTARRAEELLTHHDDRLAEVAGALAAGARTVLEVCRAITWREQVDDLPGFLLRAALGETHAHLHRLAATGAATVDAGPPERWQPGAGGSRGATPGADPAGPGRPCGPCGPIRGRRVTVDDVTGGLDPGDVRGAGGVAGGLDPGGVAGGTAWVVGAGGIGSGVAALLAHAGDDVAVVDPWPEHVAAMEGYGLRLDRPGGSLLARPRAVHLDDRAALADLGPPAVVLLATKSDATEATLGHLLPLLGDRAPVVSLQNGLNEPVIASVVGAARTVGAVVRFDGALHGPGHVAQTRDDGDLVIGVVDRPGPGSADRLGALAARLSAAVPTVAVDDVREEQWAKLARNCMLNGTATLAGLGLGRLAEVPAARRLCAAVGAEVVRVARAEGVDVPDAALYGADLDALLDGDGAAFAAFEDGFRAAYRRVPDIKPSMLQDFEKGRVVEVAHLNGAVVAAGRRLGVATPANARLVEAVLALVRGDRPQGIERVEELT